MSPKAYFQDVNPAVPDALKALRFSVFVWHLSWSALMLAGLAAMTVVQAPIPILVAIAAMSVPGVSAVMLLSEDRPVFRQGLIWLWALCAVIAVRLTGGINGPCVIWVVMPLVAAVAMNQRLLISLGATLAFVAALLTTVVSIWHGSARPDEAASVWLSILSVFTVVVSLGVALLPALRVRTMRAADAEEARTRLLTLLTEQPQLILCLDGDGKVASAYGEVPPGIDLRALMHLGLVASAHVPDRTALRNALAQVLDHGRADLGFVPHAALDHYALLSLRKGADGRIYGVLSDATLSHAQLAAVEQARSEAEMHNIGKTQFVASMSHELRTPLNAVIGFSDIMRQQLFGELSPKYAEYAQLVWESGQHVLDLINDVLDMSKIEAQKYELTLESFDMREPVSQALRLIRADTSDKSVAIVSHLPVEPLMVSADKRAIKQICLNLLSNAMKFTPRGGTVTLELTQAGALAEIAISDTGIGIAPGDLSRLGQPYQQSGTPEQKAMGTGLGLSIVRAMAELHQGSMRLESRLGEGTKVTVSLPVGHVPETVVEPVAETLGETSEGRVAHSLEAFVQAARHPDHDWSRNPDPISGFGDFVIRPSRS